MGRYEVLSRLARGSVADVLLARASGPLGFARHVVIKQIRKEQGIDQKFIDAFLAEARIGASLNHQNIVQVFDIDQVDGLPYFAMEYVHGEDVRRVLTKVVQQGKLVPLEIVVAIAAATAAGLHHAHEHLGADRKPLNLVHRDVAPSNILIGYDGSVKVVDFGLAKPALSSQKTRAGALGKAPYMSPELCLGKTVDRRSDIFALGTVMYELVTARRLFKGDNDYDTMRMIVEGQVPPPSTLRPEIPPRFDGIIMRALAKDPAARFQTAHDLHSALEAYAMDEELRTTAKAIADYLHSLFGEKPEPWTQGAAVQETSDDTIDFESAHGTVPTPSSGMQTVSTKDAPITLAAEIVRSGQTPDPDPEPNFDGPESPTRLDLPETEETTGRPRPPILPAETITGITGARTIVEGGESTTTAAQPIVDVLTGVGLDPLHPAELLRTGEQVTIGDRENTGITSEGRTLEDAFPAGVLAGAPPTQKTPTVRVPDIHARPQVLNTPPGNAPLARPVGMADGSVRSAKPSAPPFARASAPDLAIGSSQRDVVTSQGSGPQVPVTERSGAQHFHGPHGAIVPAPQAPPSHRADTDAADEATTVEPPLFPMPDLDVPAPPPEYVYQPPQTGSHSHSHDLHIPPLKRWGFVGAVLLVPIVFGLLVHACRS
ncbi:MAG: protein kinase [Kofleriaceae bacterium]